MLSKNFLKPISCFILLLPNLVFAMPPNILGEYSGTTLTRITECNIPQENGDFSSNIIATFTSQNGSSFSGFSSNPPDVGQTFFSGNVDDNGNMTVNENIVTIPNTTTTISETIKFENNTITSSISFIDPNTNCHLDSNTTMTRMQAPTTPVPPPETPETPEFAELPDNLKVANVNGLGDIEKSVAVVIDFLCPNRFASQPLLDRCDALVTRDANGLSDAQVKQALNQIAPQEALTQSTQGIEISSTQANNITARLLALRGGANGFNSSGLALNIEGQNIPGALLAAVLQGGGAGDSGQRLGIFINGNLSFGDKDATNNESGFDFDTRGITLGADYRFGESIILGTALGYAATDTEIANSAGNVDANGITLSIYGNSSLTDNLYIDWIASYGWDDYDSVRRFKYIENAVTNAEVQGSAQGDNEGNQFNVSTNVGYDIVMKGMTIGAYGRFNYVDVDVDGFQETGAENLGLNMIIAAQNVTSVTTALGLSFSYAASQSWGVLIPQASVEWEHEYKDDSRTVAIRFADATNSSDQAQFTLTTDDPDENYFNLSLGLSAQLSAGRSLFVHYDTILGLEDVTRHKITAGLRFAF